MARKRMIDPGIWTSEDYSSLSILARLIWVGLISNADDEGRGKANTSYLKSQLFPYDDELSLKKIETSLKEIEKLMSIKFYEVNGKKYYQLTKWDKFQKIDRPSVSQIPAFTQNNDAIDNHRELAEQSLNNQRTFDEQSSNNRRIIDDNSSTKKEIEKENNIVSKKEIINKFNLENKNNIINACARVREGNHLESYNEIFESFGVSDEVKDSLIEFIKHCQLNGKKVTNDKLKNIIIRLDTSYMQDEVAKSKSIHKAINSGYFDISEGR